MIENVNEIKIKTKERPKVKIKSVSEDFENHLSPKFNNRIIFSGKFGIGKTTFLKDFFRNSKYNPIWLSPVKYSVGSNEDVFEYIKFDIILELLKKYPKETFKKEIPESLFIWSYFMNKPGKILEVFIDSICSLEKGIEQIDPQTSAALKLIKHLKKTYDDYKEYKNDLKEKDKSEVELFNDYSISNMQKIGSIFENDIITQAIRTYLETLKIDGKENVLIIDDFDRLDPGHIFRILNILSVHNDYLSDTYQNKFGFDKIIIVCDKDSIKNYYGHKYGSKETFMGYIDKFCSTKFYPFSNEEAIRHFCEENIRINNLPKHCEKTLLLIILTLLDKGKITLRNLLKYRYSFGQNDFEMSENLVVNKDNYCCSNRFIDTNNFRIYSTDFPSIHIISILANILGDFDELRECLKLLKEEASEKKIPEEFIKDMVESLCLLSHLSKYYNNPEKLLFNTYKAEQCYNPGMHINNPETEFCKSQMDINLQWNLKNKYKGEKNYFEEHKIEYDLNNIELKKYQNLYTELSLILDFLDKKKFRNKI